MVDSVRKPGSRVVQMLRGIKTEGDMAPDVSLENQRPAEFVFSRNVAQSCRRSKPPGVDTKQEARKRTGRLSRRTVSTKKAAAVIPRRPFLCPRQAASGGTSSSGPAGE